MPLVRPSPLSGWTVLSLRPRGQHASVRAACARVGARLLALSVLAISARDDIATRRDLAAALAADAVIFTSPNAVRTAAALLPLRARRGQSLLAVGTGTQRALARLGIAAAAPGRMDSEGLLDLPALADPRGHSLGLVTGSGGRGLLAPTLIAHGAVLRRADVYLREAVRLGVARIAALKGALRHPQRVLLVLTSAEALAGLLAQVDDPRLRGVAVVAASPRLAQLARASGFDRVATAASARPAALLAAAASVFE
ncbi:MAG: uroporphyrinogen-III synthase [Thermomonas sp.]|uniref:uroporphyrinogen-III synthase n=1 Tax=Thermomonas sp. TaxID=1971895 RepID=UPI00261AEED7|nr:uroporphyrinogen-III synthase [Thermomonas sp.]MCC7097413.1 uroporphyrinogen-III synthase [Thermomonas sp.]